MLDEIDIKILQFIFEARTPTAKEIFDNALNGLLSLPQTYRRLLNLEKEKLIARKPLDEEFRLGASFPNFYRLTAKGGRAIGIQKLPSSSYNYHPWQNSFIRLAKNKLYELVNLKKWMLVDSERQCERLIILYLDKVAQEHEERYTSSSIPIKIPPDLVMFTGREAVIIIIPHPNAGRDAFYKRIKHYRSLIDEVRIIIINTDEDQKEEWVKAISQYDLENNASYRSRFIVLMFNQIGEIPRLLK